MKRIDGVSVEVSLDGRTLVVEDDGYVGKLTPDRVLIKAYVIPDNIYAFTVDGRKNVLLKKDRRSLTSEKSKYYRARVQIKNSEEGVYYAEYPSNHFRLLELEPNGTVKIWEIALISQDGEFFLTVQKTYEVRCYRNGQRIVCPQFDKWPQMVELLGRLLKDSLQELALVREYQPESEFTSDGLASKTARVLWFNLAQGLGALLTPEGVARVHWSEIAKRPRLAFLTPRELVSYKSLRTPIQKSRSTTFQKEAIGVKPIS